jgi:hypothetical protein
MQHDETTNAPSSDPTFILSHRQPDPSVFVEINKADELPCFDDHDMINTFILYRTHDFQNTLPKELP